MTIPLICQSNSFPARPSCIKIYQRTPLANTPDSISLHSTNNITRVFTWGQRWRSQRSNNENHTLCLSTPFMSMDFNENGYEHPVLHSTNYITRVLTWGQRSRSQRSDNKFTLWAFYTFNTCKVDECQWSVTDRQIISLSFECTSKLKVTEMNNSPSIMVLFGVDIVPFMYL